MKVRDKEIERVNKLSVKRLEPILDDIDKQQVALVNIFNENLTTIFKDKLIPILEELQKTPNIENINKRAISIDGNEYIIPVNILQDFHKSYIENPELRDYFESCLKTWFETKTNAIKAAINENDSNIALMKKRAASYALATLAISSFHVRPRIILRDNQKMAGIVMGEGDVAELSSGEGKTLSAILPTFLHALKGTGVHVMTSNSYLSKRDYDETSPIFEGLGLTIKYVPQNEEELAELKGVNYEENAYELSLELRHMKKEAYQADITYGSTDTFVFDYLSDSKVYNIDELLQRTSKPGFALVDEIDDALIDNAYGPRIISEDQKVYKENMSLSDLCELFGQSYDKVSLEVKVNDPSRLTYEEARYVAITYFNEDLLENPINYQRIANAFFNSVVKVITIQNDTYNLKKADDIFEAIVEHNDEFVDAELASDPKKAIIVFSEELKKFKISNDCFEKFIKYYYITKLINYQTTTQKEKIIKDNNYIEGEDYIIDSTGVLRLNPEASERMMNDANYPELLDDYQTFKSNIISSPADFYHYLYQAAMAHLVLKRGENYEVVNGQVVVLNNGRIQEGSTYSNGLHQAIEFKENIKMSNRTIDTAVSAQITLNDFLNLYTLTSGMTGTSQKEIFGQIYGKGTVEIPKHAYYSFFGRRKVKDALEPTGVEIKKAEFSNTLEDKINLIVNSVAESQGRYPKAPVLIVASNPEEIQAIISELYHRLHINAQKLDSSISKEEEALIVAKAGLAGAVTVSTDMAGRGTDILVGGDREKIIDIEAGKIMKKEGKCFISPVERASIRETVEKELIDKGIIAKKEEEKNNRKELEKVGLKVIASGIFKSSRIDKQVEGRTGRNGISGIYERYYTIDDLKRIGITSINSTDSIETFFAGLKEEEQGNLLIDDKTYKVLLEKIYNQQRESDFRIKESIKSAQQLNNYSTKLLEEYRERRRDILCNNINKEEEIEKMVVDATDAIISSYIKKGKINKNTLAKPINGNPSLDIDVEAISLEAKQILGIDFDPNVKTKTKISVLELRDYIAKTAMIRLKSKTNLEKNYMLLIQNDYMISAIPEIFETCYMRKNITSLSLGLEGEKDALANLEFGTSRRKLLYESYKCGLKGVIGGKLTNEEFKLLEDKKEKMQGFTKVENVDNQDELGLPLYEQDNLSIVDKLKNIKKKIDKKETSRKTIVPRKLGEGDFKGEDLDILSSFASLHIRPIKMIDSFFQRFKVRRDPINNIRKDTEGLHK